MRKTSKELEKVKKKYNITTLWSWSRYNCYNTSIYEYFLKYIAKIKEDRTDGIYGVSGNSCHNIIQIMYENHIEHNKMLSEYENELFTFNVAELKYNRSNAEKNETIAEKYEYCLKHFFKNHQLINKKVDLERFILIKIGKQLFQGYIDCVHKDGNMFIITDWKTSSIYKGQKILKERDQLLLYAEGLIQLGVPLENIKIRWNFLKYVSVEVQQANGESTVRHISRNEIGKNLTSNVKMWLKKTKKYNDEEIIQFLELLLDTNDIDCLPEDIKDKYIFKDCYIYIDFSKSDIDELKENILSTIVEINKKEVEYLKTKDDKIWWEEVTDKNSYYFANISAYSAKLHKPYGEYLDKLKNKSSNTNVESNDDDISWLNEL